MCYTFHFTNKNYFRKGTDLSIRTSSHRNALCFIAIEFGSHNLFFP